ncbi:MAG: PAS domain S-box protein [Deltaproteobacteria bacterium]|nr:PAS domain S-box protein [Deltaproteobacteria bacterium]
MPKVKILIVEDEKIVAMDIRKSVETMGYFVCAIASSGEEAIQKADETRPDLALMDIVLKGDMDGIKAAEQINALFKIPIVYITAYDDEDILQRAKITTPYGYITKPFNDRELRIAIEIALYKNQAEVRIRKTELWLAAVLRSVGDAVIASDKEGQITFMNQVAEELTGWKKEDALGKRLTEVLHIKDEDLGSLEKRLVEKVITQGLIINLLEDRLLVSKDGTVIPVSDSLAPIKGDDGETPGTVLVFRDITERKKVEEALRESEERYRSIFNGVLEGIYQTSPQGKNLAANPALARILGYDSAEEVVASVTDSAYQVWANPNERSHFITLLEEHETVYGYECQFLRKDKTNIWVSLTSRRVCGPDGQLLYYEGLVEDITERKRAEKVLQESKEFVENLIDSMLDGFSVLDSDGVQIGANAAFCQMTGFSREELIGVGPPHPYWPQEAHEEIERGFQKTLRGEFSDVELTFMRKNGERFPVIVSPSWIQDKQGNVVSYFATVKDITSRKWAEEELKTSTEQLRALAARLQQIREEERIMIAREIHDELGGGLTGLKMELSWLLHKVYDTEAGKERVALMSKIHESNELMDRLIQVVRRMATDLRPSVLDDLGLIAALEWQLQEFTSRTGISHEFVTAFDYVNLEEATAVAVFRIFQETLTNVTRHSGATKVTVLLREGERSLFEGDSLFLEIRDNGKGIMEGEIQDAKSLGILGMRERALVFGGDLQISGEPDSGTTVVLKIPQKPGETS